MHAANEPDLAFRKLRDEHKTLDRHARLSELCSSLKYSDVKIDDLTRAEALDMMTTKLLSWQEQLGAPHTHPMLCKDRIIQAVSGENFSSALSIDPPLDPNQAAQRLHLGISNLEKLEQTENAALKAKIVNYANAAFGRPKGGRFNKSDRRHVSSRSKIFKGSKNKKRKLNVGKAGKRDAIR